MTKLFSAEQSKPFRIVVAGGGPAGCATAIGLSSLGYDVTMITILGRRDTIEGLSARTAEALKTLGARYAASSLGPVVERYTDWNSIVTHSGQECLVKREVFDQAFIKDAVAAGVRVKLGYVMKALQTQNGWQVLWRDKSKKSDQSSLICDFFVEARGRSAPRRFEQPARGPKALALIQHWILKTPRDTSYITALANGWAWWASSGRDASFQYVCTDVKESNIRDTYQQSIDHCPSVRHWLRGAQRTGSLTACDASIKYYPKSIGSRWIRVGDSCLAPDPLSGQGVFEAIASAYAAVPTINTLLKKPERLEYAEKFYQQRYEQRFLSIARTGRDYYRMESRSDSSSFWSERTNWPDDNPSHSKPTIGKVCIEDRPVVIDSYITNRRVIISDDYPRGIWKLNNIPLVEFIKYIKGGGKRAEIVFPSSTKDIDRTIDWLQARQLL